MHSRWYLFPTVRTGLFSSPLCCFWQLFLPSESLRSLLRKRSGGVLLVLDMVRCFDYFSVIGVP